MKNGFFIKIVVAVAVSWFTCANAQDEVQGLFVYPQAPDTCTSLESRSNYVVAHFWDDFDLAKPITNDASLVKTFRDYADLFRFAHKNIVLSSVRDFMFKLRSNSLNLSKMGRVAELVLYSPFADYWSDEVYVEFAKSIVSATTLPKEERDYYQRQIGRINACQEGMIFDLEYTDVISGQKKKVSDITSDLTLLLFLDSSVDSSIGRTRLASDVNFQHVVDDGKLTIVCIHEGKPGDEWANGLPEKWAKGYTTGLMSQYDIRLMPSCYMLDGEHRIMNKNITIDDLKAAVE